MTEPSTWAALVPELLVGDIKKSLFRFRRDICRLAVLYDRPDEGFAYRDLGGAQITSGLLAVGSRCDGPYKASGYPLYP